MNDEEWEARCNRDRAWNEAREDLFNDTLSIVDARLLNCLKYGTADDMTPGCLTKLLAAYPE